MELKFLINEADRLKACILLGKYLRNASEKEFRFLIENWDVGLKWDYPNPWRLACNDHIEWSCEDKIYASLFLTCLEDFVDYREKLIEFAVIYNSCLLCKLNPENIFSTVGHIFGGKILEELQEWLDRDEEDKSLIAFEMSSRKVETGYEIFNLIN